MTEGLVSVVIPVYNAENYVGETIESVLKQTYSNFEIIIVDDCGSDNSMEVVKQYKDERIKILHNDKNRGIAYSRNRGIANAEGEYIALLDNDDIAVDTRLQKQIDFLQKHPEIDIVGGNAQWIDEEGNIIRDMIQVIEDPLYIEMLFLFRNIFNNSEMTFRKSVIEMNNIIYSDNCLGMEDFLFWIQCSKVAKFGCIPDLVLKKRVFEENETGFVKNNKFEERRIKYWELQKTSLRLSGFVLNEHDEQILFKMFGESGYDMCNNSQELQEYYLFMKKLLM